MNPKVTIIILNWKGWIDTIECLESLLQINYPDYNVIILDNNSHDNSIKKIKEYLEGYITVKSSFFEYIKGNKPLKYSEFTKEEAEKRNMNLDDLNLSKVVIIKNDKNYGFAEGNNIGIRFALDKLNSDYVMLLNNDTVVNANFLDILIKSIENNNEIGVIGPQINYYDDKDKIQTLGWDLNWNKGKGYPTKESPVDLIEVDFIGGCSILFKNELIKEIGYWNSEYFAYWEDIEFCYRVKKAGYSIICNIHSKIWHKGSVSTSKITGLGIYYVTRNRFWFMKKYATKKQYIIFSLYFIFYEFWISMAYYVITNNLRELSCYYNGFKKGFKK